MSRLPCAGGECHQQYASAVCAGLACDDWDTRGSTRNKHTNTQRELNTSKAQRSGATASTYAIMAGVMWLYSWLFCARQREHQCKRGECIREVEVPPHTARYGWCNTSSSTTRRLPRHQT